MANGYNESLLKAQNRLGKGPLPLPLPFTDPNQSLMAGTNVFVLQQQKGAHLLLKDTAFLCFKFLNLQMLLFVLEFSLFFFLPR